MSHCKVCGAEECGDRTHEKIDRFAVTVIVHVMANPNNGATSWWDQWIDAVYECDPYYREGSFLACPHPEHIRQLARLHPGQGLVYYDNGQPELWAEALLGGEESIHVQ